MFKKVAIGILLLLMFSVTGINPVAKGRSSLHLHHQRKCTCYSIVEFGKAVNCKGDTIILDRKNGLQVFIANSN